jgi:hypothetical protein
MQDDPLAPGSSRQRPMHAYSFKPRFIPLIIAGKKTQLIKSGRARNAQPGDTLRFYTSMRAGNSQLIGVAECLGVEPVQIDLDNGRIEYPATGSAITLQAELDAFAESEGFPGFNHADGMVPYWREKQPMTPIISGFVVRWHNFVATEGAPDQAA